MNGLIFDDATCEMVRPPLIVFKQLRQRDYIRVEFLPAPTPPSRPTMRAIRQAVVDHYGLDAEAMTTHRRFGEFVRPRQLAMYLCRELTERSLPEIGRAFGGRDHSTVIHAIRAVQDRLAINPDIRTDHDAILEALGE